jgi:hypothetical protein
MNLYAYCLSDEVAGHMIERVAGVASASPPRLIRYGGIVAVVSDFEGESVGLTRGNVFAHERVIGGVLAHTTPLPFRFGTVVSAPQLERYVNSRREFLRAQLERVRDCVEMSVKVIRNVEAAKRGAAARSAKPDVTDDASGAARGRGAAFLEAKRREILGDERLKTSAEETAAWLAARLNDTVRETQVSLRPASALFMAAAHMVARARLEEYRARLRAARAARGELHFLTSGPWPPYSFTQTNS